MTALALLRTGRDVLRHRRGNVIMMFALALPVLGTSIGMGVDYARAMQAQTKLNAIADAAALSAVSKTALPTTDSNAADNAKAIFRAMAAPLTASGEVRISDLTVDTATDRNGRRNATVTYTAVSHNVFGGILGLSSLTIGGRSATTNAIAPDIDFYMLLDVSSSMALPTTTAGLAKVAASNDRNCQFACHSVNDLQGRAANGQMTDLYGVAKSYGLPLRIDDEGRAVSKLTANATAVSSKNGADYRIAIATFRGRGAFSILQQRTTNMVAAAKTTTNLVPHQYYSNGRPSSADDPSEPGYDDQDTGISDAIDQINTRMITTPGSGVGNKAPQGILFIVTDGMRDEYRPGGLPEVEIDTAKCDMIKARGLRIAILYTEYLKESLTGDWWSETFVKPRLYKVEPALQACASSGLYTKVTTDQDISTALDALFQNAVATARITK
ncbi:TadE/TadG family type IV pilus assembly protein [Sphingomonas fuzhouensis]|uniref:TadE/TadG family type IV pilus assembly protein n=1 Tax=Sphingomonas fuzhouensis TaxID=3106033 RepID=UPI002AFE371B|nr:pilus assembly protein TadG-related protein [Sphingomonas sp. SGZ-02]